MKRVISVCAFLGFILFISSQAHALTFFTDRALWEVAVGGPGFWQDVSEAQIPTGFSVFDADTKLALPYSHTLEFTTDLLGVQVPTDWATWSGGNTPRVLWTDQSMSVTGIFDDPWAFGLEMEPNVFGPFDMTLAVLDINGDPILDPDTQEPLSLIQSVGGLADAKFFGWTFGDDVESMVLSADGDSFAFGRMVISDNQPIVPEPTSLSLLGLGLLGLLGIRKKK